MASISKFTTLVQNEVLAECGDQRITIDRFCEILREALEGQIGVSLLETNWQYVLQLVSADGTLLFFHHNTRIDPSNIAFKSPNIEVGTEAKHLNFLYTGGRPLKLTETQFKALSIIAKSKRRGITQSTVAKELDMDPRSLFHQLKTLFAFNLITKVPVSHQRTFTFLLHLAPFSPSEEEGEIDNETEEGDASSQQAVLPAPIVRQRITSLLKNAPQKTLSLHEIYRLDNVRGRSHKVTYRRSINWLVTHGFVECLISDELGGGINRIFKFRKALTNFKEVAEPKSYESKIATLSAVINECCLERQIHDFINAAGPQGVTLAEIMHAFGIGRKFAYRVGERLTSKKIIANSDVFKIAEFDGKERRHRFFTNAGKSQTDNATSSNQEILELQTPSVVARDSINRSRRLKALLDAVNQAKVVEVGKSLAISLQEKLQEKDHLMDTKTLKRLIQQLESELLVKSVVVALPNGINKTVLFQADLSLDDPIVKAYLDAVKKSKIELHTIEDEDGFKNEEAGEQVLLPTGVLSSREKRDHKFKMQKHGFIYGLLARCRILHRYILDCVYSLKSSSPSSSSSPSPLLLASTTEPEWIIETVPCLFRNIPLGIFMAVVGLGEMSSELTRFIKHLSLAQKKLPLDSLPVSVKKEIHRRRIGAHKIIIKKILDRLVQLRLVAPDSRFPGVAFRIPYQYQVSKSALIININGESREESLNLAIEDNFTKYWQWLESLSSKNEATLPEALPSVYHEACSYLNWRTGAPQRKALNRKIREIIKTSQPETLTKQQIDELREEFLAEESDIQGAFEQLLKEYYEFRTRRAQVRRMKRENFTRLKRMRRLQPSPAVLPLEEAPELGAEDYLTVMPSLKPLSDKDLYFFRLLYIILHWPRFSTVGHVNWQLSLRLAELEEFSKIMPASSDEFRRIMLRISCSYDQIKLLFEVEYDIALIRAASSLKLISQEPVATTETDQQAYFTEIIRFYHGHLQNIDKIKSQITVKVDFSKFMEPPTIKEIPWRKFARSQQIQYFEDFSLDTIPEEAHLDDEVALEIEMLRVYLFGVSPEEFNAGSIKDNLKNLDEDRVRRALSILEKHGLISTKECVGFVSRHSQLEYFVNEEFVQLVDGQITWPQFSRNDDLASVLQRITLLESLLELRSSKGQLTCEEIENKQQAKILENRLDEAISLYCSTTLSTREIWSSPLGDIRPTILRSACCKVVELLLLSPWISLKNLTRQCWPLLSKTEVHSCLKVLHSARLVEIPQGYPPDSTEVALTFS